MRETDGDRPRVRPRVRLARTARHVVVAGAASVALVLEAIWIAGNPALWPWHQAGPAQAVAMSVVVLTWLGLLLSRFAVARALQDAFRYANALAMLAVATALFTAVLRGSGSIAAAADIAVLTAAALGLLLDVRAAALSIAVLVVVEAATITVAGQIPTDVLLSGFTLTVGVAAAAARAALTRQAASVDAAWGEAIALEAERRAHEEMQESMRRDEQALTSSVIAPLAAIARGPGPQPARADLVGACGFGAQVLDRLLDDPGGSEILAPDRDRVTPGPPDAPGAPDAPDAPIPSDEAYVASGFALAAPVLGAFAVFTLASLAGSVTQVDRPALAVLAFAVIMAGYAVLLVASRRGGVGWRAVGIVVASSIVGFWAQHAAQGAAELAWADWSSFAVAGAFFVLLALGPTWAWPIVLGAWFVLQGDVVAELTSAGTATLVAGALFGHSTRRNFASLEAARSADHEHVVAMAVADSGLRRLRDRYCALEESSAGRLLAGVAAGSVDPDDPRVQAQAAAEECFVRTVVEVDPRADRLNALVIDVARAAREAGIALTCEVGSGWAPSVAGLSMVRTTLVSAIGLASRLGPATLSVESHGGDLAVRLLAVVGPGRTAEAVALPIAGYPVAPASAHGQQMRWQWRGSADSDVHARS